MPGKRVSPGRHYFNRDDVVFACLDSRADGHDSDVGPNPEYIYLAVEDLDNFAERTSNMGLLRLSEIKHQPWGERAMYTTDPFGNPICLVDSSTLFRGGRSLD